MVLAVLLYVVAAVVAQLVGKLVPRQPQPAEAAIHMLVTLAIIVPVYKLAIARLGERPRDDLQLSGAAKGVAIGLLAGFAIFSAVVCVAALAGAYRIVACCSAGQPLRILIGAGIMAGVMEELLFRGILFRWIEEFAGSWAALTVTSALFGLAHIFNPGATWFSSLSIAVEAGILLGGCYMLTRSLWLPIGLHAAWNFAEGYIYDVPVSGQAEQGLVTAKLAGPQLLSGGAFGLEASIIAVIIAGSAGIWFVWRASRKGEVVQPSWVRRRSVSST
jgi:membrane protease YdiL (CAAX protease family)